MEWGETPSDSAADFLRVPVSWWVRRSCKAVRLLDWLEFLRGTDGRDEVGGAGWIPVRRDLTGYTYELGGWAVDPSSPSCMIERMRRGKNQAKNDQEVINFCFEGDNSFRNDQARGSRSRTDCLPPAENDIAKWEQDLNS